MVKRISENMILKQISRKPHMLTNCHYNTNRLHGHKPTVTALSTSSQLLKNTDYHKNKPVNMSHTCMHTCTRTHMHKFMRRPRPLHMILFHINGTIKVEKQETETSMQALNKKETETSEKSQTN